MSRLYVFALVFVVVVLTSCSSIASDAQQAAKLNRKSLEYVQDKRMDKADEAYREMQKLVNKYRNTENYTRFSEEYATAMYGKRTN